LTLLKLLQLYYNTTFSIELITAVANEQSVRHFS